jgi:nitrite reductase/ring-hydroxylating ferredoxin subunit
MTNASLRLCAANDIPDEDSRGFDIDGQAVFAVKKDGVIHVYRNRCPHLGVTLEWNEHQFLDADKALIQCATHGALFIIDSGECVAGPCLGKALTTVPHQIIDGVVLIELFAENEAQT